MAGRASFGGEWSGNVQLEVRLKGLQALCEKLKLATTKVAMMRAEPITPSIMTVYVELDICLNSLVGLFKEVCEECSASKALLDIVFKAVSAVLSRVKELCDLVQASTVTVFEGAEAASARTAPVATGMVWSACDALTKLPLSNKAAYRWVALQSMLTTKETIEEFSQYVKTAKKKAGGETQDDNDDDDDDDDDWDDEDGDDEGYTAAEIAAVEEVLLVLAQVQASTRSTLQGMSKAADTNGWGNGEEGQLVICSTVDTIQDMRGDVVDLAAELFPPFDDAAITAGRTAVQDGLDAMLELSSKMAF